MSRTDAEARSPPRRPGDAGFALVLEQARELRDFLLRSRSRRNGELITALLAFESDAGTPPKPADRDRLYSAFQAAHAEAAGLTDRQTLSQVLAGRSPHRRAGWRQFAGTVLLMLLGLYLASITLAYSNWASRANVILADMDEFKAFDHSASVLRLVDMEGFFEETVADPQRVAAEPILSFKKELDELAEYYRLESRLLEGMVGLVTEDQPVALLPKRTANVACDLAGWTGPRPPLPDGPAAVAATRVAELDGGAAVAVEAGAGPARSAPFRVRLLSRICPPLPLPPAAPSGSFEAAAPTAPAGASGQGVSPAAAGGSPGASDGFVAYNLGGSRLIDFFLTEFPKAVKSTGRDPMQRESVTESSIRLTEIAARVRNRLAIVQNWWLPALYGSLGAFAFCMWRVLDPQVTRFSIAEVLPRIVFGAFAGLTLTMLFVPSNVMALDPTAGRPLIYLTAFVFGYSVESFVATLNNLNSLIAKATGPKEAGT